MDTPSRNEALAARAARVIPGGVNSASRRAAWPLVVAHAAGAHFTDADGNTYLDYHAAFGPLVLGHNHPRVNAAARAVTERLDLIGIGVTEAEVELAETVSRHVPSAERVLLASSGSEVTLQAIRLARAVTGRRAIVKVQGGYHGWHDAVAMNVTTPRERLGQKDLLSLGMLPEVVEQTHVLPYNDVEALRELTGECGHEIAAVIVEAIPHNIGCVLPRPEFLRALRQTCDERGIVLIFDEVVTGFRHALGGFQSLCGVTPDLTTFAKAIANGYPIAALVGRAALMDRFGPGGGVYWAGTYNGHPVSVAAALATIAELADGSVYRHTAALAERLAGGLGAIAAELGVPLTVRQFGSIFVPYFFAGPAERYEDLRANDTARDLWFRRAMCERGIFMLPVALKRSHVSAAHTVADIDRTLETAREVLRAMPTSV